MGWQELDPKEIESRDEFIENYKGWKIYFYIPNGGIVAVTISNGKVGYGYPSEVESKEEGIDRYCDSEWHLQKAKTFINSINKPTGSINQRFVQLELNLFND